MVSAPWLCSARNRIGRGWDTSGSEFVWLDCGTKVDVLLHLRYRGLDSVARRFNQYMGGREMTSFPLFTSIKPLTTSDDLSYLRDCLDSWQRAGFDAVAVNGPNEIARLRKLDLPVKFSALPSDGKPRIGAILAAIKETGVRFAGMINCDCKIIGYPSLALNLHAALEQTILVGWRIDIGDGSPRASFGFDAYFFDTAFLPEDDAGFCIGGPWWDYWFPLACAVAGANIETLPAPLMTHKVHPLNYTLRNELDGCTRFWMALKKWYVDGRNLPSWPFDETYVRDCWSEKISTLAQAGEISALVRSWIRRHTARASIIPGMDEIETVVRLGGDALVAGAEVHHQIAALRNSVSWRITAPLRQAAAVVRTMAAW
jgi:hypothetical protein